MAKFSLIFRRSLVAVVSERPCPARSRRPKWSADRSVRGTQCISHKRKWTNATLLRTLGKKRGMRISRHATNRQVTARAGRKVLCGFRLGLGHLRSNPPRMHLAIVGIDGHSHELIANQIRQLDNPFAQGFALLHWTRIGGLAALDRGG